MQQIMIICYGWTSGRLKREKKVVLKGHEICMTVTAEATNLNLNETMGKRKQVVYVDI